MSDQRSGGEQAAKNLSDLKKSDREWLTMLPCLKSWQHFLCHRVKRSSRVQQQRLHRKVSIADLEVLGKCKKK